jgi:hypothetical protein
MQVGACMIAGADHKIGLSFDYVRFFAIESNLMAPLKEFSVVLDHGVVTAGGSVLQRVAIPVVFHGVLRTGAIGGTPHARLPEVTGYFPMATATHGGIHVLRLDYSRGKQAGDQKPDGLPHF